MKNKQYEERDRIIEAVEALIPEDILESPEDEKPRSRIFQIDKVETEVTFEQWRQTILDNFPDLLFPAELALAVMAQILITDITNPFAVVLIDVPSSGKTIVINFFSDIEGLTYATDKFTTAAFVSNAANVKKEKLGAIDLLPRIRYQMLLLRDLATVFSKRDDELKESLGLLTRVLDGEGLKTESGVHGQRGYSGEYLFMLLAASTPIYPNVWKIMGNLGSRLFFLNMKSRDKTEAELAEQITSHAYKDRENACRQDTSDFLRTLWYQHPDGINWDREKDGNNFKIIIARCAKLLAKLRGVINVWQENTEDGVKYSYTTPVIEKADRINQLLYNLARGHAVVSGRTQIGRDDLKVVLEIVTDSAPANRVKLFRKLLSNKGQIKTHEVEEALACAKPTALKEMEILKILGIGYITEDSYGHVGSPENTLHLVEGLQWFLSAESQELRI